MVRPLLLAWCCLGAVAGLPAQAPTDAKDRADAKVDRRVYDALRELHNQGADLYNANDLDGAYRYFQATVKFAREMLAHRPGTQLMIDEELQKAERQPTIARRTFAMHLLVEKIREDLRGEDRAPPPRPDPNAGPMKMPAGPDKSPRPAPPRPNPISSGGVTPDPDKGPELLRPFPRELPPTKIDGPSLPPPPKKDPLLGLSTGVGGRVLFRGRYLPGISVVFVSRDQPRLLTFETVSDRDGIYRLETALAGRYTVLLTPTSESPIKSLPERYATVQTSSFILETRAGGEIADIVLQ